MAAQDDQMIAALAAQQLGVPTPEAAPSAPAQVDPAKADAPTTDAEKMTEAVSPQTEGDKQREESFIEVDFGDGRKEVMSNSQIAGMTSRYKDLNHKNATRYKPMEPAIGVLEQLMQSATSQGHNVSGDDMAQFITAAIRGYTSNPQMGGQTDPTPDRPDGNDFNGQMDSDIEAWERDNAISLPPMYRQGFKLMQQLMQENESLKGNMGQLLNQAQQLNQEAAQQAQGAIETGDTAYRQLAANNLNEAQQNFQLPDDAEDDFFDFAYGRGYTVEDFIDRDLTMKIMQDFSANRQTPEMERLRALNAKRQAFTGASSAAPSMGAGSMPSGGANDDFMQSVAAQAMQKRGLA